jgi:hypothetical protein
MEKDKEKTIVIFKKDADGLFAFFPELPGTNDPYSCTYYVHVGQHSTGDVAYMASVRRAKPEEYADLFRELESLGYNLDVRRRVSQHMNRNRIAELRK